jgi:ABC-type transport system involved in multi-copper enzyme maturation permease subunit
MTTRLSGTRRVWLITRNEWAEAIRSRRALVVVLLYLGAALLTMNGFLSLLLRLENQLAEALLLPAADQPGAVVDALWRSERFRQMVAGAVRSDVLVQELTGQSPIVLVFAGLAFFYTPLLVALVAPVRVAEELAGGSIRYVALRTSRLSWTLGKFLGQALLFGVALLASALGAWLLARYRMAGADGWVHAGGMLVWCARVWVYGLAFLGLLMGLAHRTRSPSRCTALSLFTVFVLTLLAWAFERYEGEGLRQVFPVLAQFLPQSYRQDLWRSSAAHLWPAVLALVALGLTYLLAGYAVFRRRDI